MTLLNQSNHIPNYIKNQLGRAGLSILLNIAEGSGRSSQKERRNFLVIARGSVFECAAILDLLNAQKEINPETHKDLKEGYEEISRMLYAMINRSEPK